MDHGSDLFIFIMRKLINHCCILLGSLVVLLNSAPAWSANNDVISTPTAQHTKQYIAKNESVQVVLNSISGTTGKPIVVSALAQKKTVSGNFDTSDLVKLVEQLSLQYGLIWYDNGQTMFIYDNSELKNTVITLRNASLASLNEFLDKAGLASRRYPIRADQSNTAIYVAGPPAYVDIVTNAANYLDDLYGSTDPDKQAAVAAPAGSSGYVAKNESIQFLFNAVSSEARKPYILSKLAAKKTVTGDFDISNPARFLEKISNQIGLVWYDDGQSIFVYDNTELKNAVVMLRSATIASLNEFLQRTGLASTRYPLRGEDRNNAFYVAGPPAYVDIVVNAAAYLDDLYKNVDLNKQRISIIKLHNTFVNDRKISVRDQTITIAGIGKVIEAILANDKNELISIDSQPTVTKTTASNGGTDTSPIASTEKKIKNEASQIKVIPYPDTNSLLVKGTQEQIDLIQTLVEQLDVPKRHIELSLWIIDVNKSDLDKLGVDWQVGLKLGGNAQFNITTNNGTAASLDGTKFLAQIYALSSKGQADVVSRPIVLTQDNVPASFDNNSTFYAQVTGERVANLESITYGTMINVLPRYSPKGDEVEMVLDIEDGQTLGATSNVGLLPTVNRTKLSTIARVPKDKSLLIGGYTREEYTHDKTKIPLLGDLPYIGSAFRTDSETYNKKVRVFLIQPKLIELGSSWNPEQFAAPSTLAPQMPLSETLKLLRTYAEPPNVKN